MPILKQDIKDVNEIKFTVTTKHVPQTLSNVKFRASIIQEHKEVVGKEVSEVSLLGGALSAGKGSERLNFFIGSGVSAAG